MKFILVCLLILLCSCESITQIIDGDDYYKAIDNKSKKESLSLIFSHNINGELEPCGCRHHPLGGISQVAGFFHKNAKSHVNFYVDTGDTLFPSPVIPKSMNQSLKYTAKKIASALDDLGLKYYLPGDQDFAAGISFLQDIANKHKFQFLISNLSSKAKLKHKKIGLRSFGKQEFVFLGLIDPKMMNNYSNLFNDPISTLSAIFSEHPEFKTRNIILLSHMGMETDKMIASKFPFIKWIIGAHNQSFLKEPLEEKQSSIVQVLSRNHYLGVINFNASVELAPKYELIEMRQHWEKEYPENPFTSLIQTHRTELKKIQQEEQKSLMDAQIDKTVYKKPTTASCLECHQDQADHWMGTAHALAFQTLRKNQADANPQCIGCHSLDYQKETGFLSANNIVQFKDNKKHEAKLKKYLAGLDTIFKNTKEIRSLSSKKRSKLTKKWLELDKSLEVTHNFANVQCLNCHTQSIDHPFEDTEQTKSAGVDSNKCLSCHTADQSPEWYKSTHPPEVNDQVLKSMLKKVACPKKKP